MASVLLLGAGRGQVPAYRAARDLGLDIIAVDPDAQAPGLALAAHRYSFDLGDIGRLIALGRKHGVVGVFTMAADYPIPALAEVCAALALPGLTPTAAHQATHKHRMREVFAEHGVPVPEFHHAASAEQAIALARRLPGDAIMKPALSQGGRGVTRVARDADEAVLITAFAHALRHELLLRPIGNTVYFMPPYVISEDEMRQLLQGTRQVIDETLDELST